MPSGLVVSDWSSDDQTIQEKLAALIFPQVGKAEILPISADGTLFD